MNEDFLLALHTLEKEKGINKDTLFEAIEAALISAYRRNFSSAHNVRVQIERTEGKINVFSCLNVVERVTNAQQEISLEEAKKINPLSETGDLLEIEVTPRNFGRIAAQTAKQVVIQRIREAERELIYEEYIDREDDIVTGVIHRFEQKNAIINLGRAEAILPTAEQLQGESYRQGDRIKVYITEVRKTTKGPQIFVSRTHPGLIKRLFELEVPEIYNGIVEIKSVAREPGNRSKVAVFSRNKDVDPVGACVGPKGSRVQAIVNELSGEKIDIIEWNDDPEIFLASTLSPAKTIKVKVNTADKAATAIVPDYQLSLAIGREGQNVRLAARLSGWKIDIVSESSYLEKIAAKKEAEEREATAVQEPVEVAGIPLTEPVASEEMQTVKAENEEFKDNESDVEHKQTYEDQIIQKHDQADVYELVANDEPDKDRDRPLQYDLPDDMRDQPEALIITREPQDMTAEEKKKKEKGKKKVKKGKSISMMDDDDDDEYFAKRRGRRLKR